MTAYLHRVRNSYFALAVTLLTGCAPSISGPGAEPSAFPPIPEIDGPLEIRVVHPTGRTPLPNVDSAYIYGSVGTGAARLTINGSSVPVYRNGAFLAYLPLPQTGTYILEASAGGAADVHTVNYVMPSVEEAADPPIGTDQEPEEEIDEVPPAFVEQIGVVSSGADTLVTGSDVAIGRPTPTGTYRWFLPDGARVTIIAEWGDQVEVRLDSGTTAWLPADAVTLLGPADSASTNRVGIPTFDPAPAWLDVEIPANGAPFLVTVSGDTVGVTLYGVEVSPGAVEATDPLVSNAWFEAGEQGSGAFRLTLASSPWGYKAFYSDDGDLVLRLRRPPEIDAADPLRGLRIAVDAGHPPGGATGPTGLTEAEANLAISLALAEQLGERGAEVLLTRPDAQSVGLEERVDAATAWDADLLISVHNNAFAEGVNPFQNAGSSVYYFHPFARDVAEALVNEISATTGIRNLGAKWSNLALARPSWMPSVLTESLFMLMPRQEAALRNLDFIERLAAAHVRGVERAILNFEF